VRSALDGDDGEIELSLVHPTRGDRRYTVIVSAIAGRPGYGTDGVLLCFNDVTDDVHERAEIVRRATHDALTRCLNREAVLGALGNAIAGCDHRSGVAVVFLDLDRLKYLNDTFGHAAGDSLLVCVADRLRNSTRDASIGRFGGDEFLVVARDVASAEQADHLGRRLARELRRPVRLGGSVTRPSASAGVAWTNDPAADAMALVAQADAAMYEIKRRRAAYPGMSRLSQRFPRPVRQRRRRQA
jgi:diguanylate cyclase (GGDEF)-like protein